MCAAPRGGEGTLRAPALPRTLARSSPETTALAPAAWSVKFRSHTDPKHSPRACAPAPMGTYPSSKYGHREENHGFDHSYCLVFENEA